MMRFMERHALCDDYCTICGAAGVTRIITLFS